VEVWRGCRKKTVWTCKNAPSATKCLNMVVSPFLATTTENNGPHIPRGLIGWVRSADHWRLTHVQASSPMHCSVLVTTSSGISRAKESRGMFALLGAVVHGASATSDGVGVSHLEQCAHGAFVSGVCCGQNATISTRNPNVCQCNVGFQCHGKECSTRGCPQVGLFHRNSPAANCFATPAEPVSDRWGPPSKNG
jgi:hypothetical protein